MSKGASPEWFEEVCCGCNKTMLVHNDKNSSYDNPTFICMICENERDKAVTMYERGIC